MTWAIIPMLHIKLMSLGKWGVRTQDSFTNRFPFCGLILFCRSLTGGIQNGFIPVLPWQVNQFEPWQGDHAHTICHNLDGFPMTKIGKGQRTSASLPLHPFCSSQRGTTAAGLHTVAAGGWQLSEEPLMGSSSPGIGEESEFQSSQLRIDSWVQEEIGNFTVQPVMLPVSLGFGSQGTKREKKMETLIDFRCFRG